METEKINGLIRNTKLSSEDKYLFLLLIYFYRLFNVPINSSDYYRIVERRRHSPKGCGHARITYHECWSRTLVLVAVGSLAKYLFNSIWIICVLIIKHYSAKSVSRFFITYTNLRNSICIKKRSTLHLLNLYRIFINNLGILWTSLAKIILLWLYFLKRFASITILLQNTDYLQFKLPVN